MKKLLLLSLLFICTSCVQSLTITNGSTITLASTNTLQLNLTGVGVYIPTDITWTTESDAKITVSSTGLITGQSTSPQGDVYITAEYKYDTTVYDQIKVTHN